MCNKRVGGVALYINSKLTHTILSPPPYLNNSTTCDICTVDVSLLSSKSVTITVCYRPPDADCTQFCHFLTDYFDYLTIKNKFSFLAGDFNVNLLDPNHSTLPSHYSTPRWTLVYFPPSIYQPESLAPLLLLLTIFSPTLLMLISVLK